MNDLCVIMLTKNRVDLFKRSIYSLFRNAEKFDLCIFDDNSLDTNYAEMTNLDICKKNKNIKWHRQEKAVGINRNMMTAIHAVTTKYENYLILDSDVELLEKTTIDSLKECLSFEKEGQKTYLTCPQCAGFYMMEYIPFELEFFNGHSISIDKVKSGCCLMFSDESFNLFKKDSLKFDISDKNIGIDTIIYKHLRKYGLCLTIEDEIVYHMQGYFGQRKNDISYFTVQSELNIINNELLSFIEISKKIYPEYVKSSELRKMLRVSHNYETFEERVFDYIKDNQSLK